LIRVAKFLRFLP